MEGLREDYGAPAKWAIVKPAHAWYHVARVIFVDGAWFELYWHQDYSSLPSKARLARACKDAGLRILPGVFRPLPGGRALEQT